MVNTSIPSLLKNDNMEFVSAIRYSVPVEADIVATILAKGMFEHLVGGPGLAIDVLKIKDKKAADGRLYLVYTTEPEKLLKWYEENPQHAVRTDSTFKDLFVCDNGAYAVAIIYPDHYGMKIASSMDLCLTNKDCLMKYMKADIALDIQSDGTYIYKPKQIDISSSLAIVNERTVMNRFSQIYIKAYARLGFTIDFNAYLNVWKWICARNHLYNDVNDSIKISEWINNLKKEPITLVR